MIMAILFYLLSFLVTLFQGMTIKYKKINFTFLCFDESKWEQSLNENEEVFMIYSRDGHALTAKFFIVS